MRETFTKGMARNIYYGGAVFFLLVLVGLTFDTVAGLPETDNRQNLTEEVAAGKRLWEVNNCVGCHSLLGEGAYFAPELGNVYARFGENTDAIKALLKTSGASADHKKAIIEVCQNGTPSISAPANPSRLVTISEAADLLAVSTRTVRRMIDGGIIPSRKVYRSRRIPLSAITDLINGGQKRTSEVPKDEDSFRKAG